MNPKDLRIGNLVYYFDKIIEIESLHPQNDDVNDEIPFHCISGIKITKEWLIKLGFIKENDCDNYYLENDKTLHLFYIEKYLEEDDYVSIQYFNIPLRQKLKIKYVHQLQNLFYSIRNYELSVS